MQFRCSALLFDLDGVLVDSRAVVERTCRRWALRHQLDPDEVLRIAHGRRTRDTVKAAAPHLETDREAAWIDAVELADIDGLSAVPGSPELLAALPPTSWAVVTSCGRALAELRLTSVGLPIPRIVVTSEDVAHGKPAPDGYRLGAKRLGQDAAACIVFEDDTRCGVLSEALRAQPIPIGRRLPVCDVFAGHHDPRDRQPDRRQSQFRQRTSAGRHDGPARWRERGQELWGTRHRAEAIDVGKLHGVNPRRFPIGLEMGRCGLYRVTRATPMRDAKDFIRVELMA